MVLARLARAAFTSATSAAKSSALGTRVSRAIGSLPRAMTTSSPASTLARKSDRPRHPYREKRDGLPAVGAHDATV